MMLLGNGNSEAVLKITITCSKTDCKVDSNVCYVCDWMRYGFAIRESDSSDRYGLRP